MGFAIDLGQLYLIRSELKSAANSMALAAASKLIGTDAALDTATNTARLTIGDQFGNKYNFAGLTIGETTGNLSSVVNDPTYYAAVVDAIGDDASTGGEAGGATAKHVRVVLQADAPLTFWSFLSLGQERKASIKVKAVAGISAPVCTACGIEPLAIAPVDATDTVDFGYIVNTRYTFAFSCSGGGNVQPINGAVTSYILLDRLDPNAQVFSEDAQQAYRIGAQGMPGNSVSTVGCVRVNSDGEAVWVTATPGNCGQVQQQQPTIQGLLCGIASRFESTAPSVCSAVTDVDTMLAIYSQDTDLTDLDDYSLYVGNGRRIITVPIVDALNPAGGMIVQGFRQFLVDPNPNATNVDPSDNNGRFTAIYLGTVMPVRQGLIGGCPQQTNGPGKVVLHQ
jgi:Flp pilus assembly protein TadG